MLRTAIYARFPKKGEHDLEQCYVLMKKENGMLTNIFIDLGQNGFVFDRLEFKKLELCVKKRLVDMVVIPSLMHFCRDISKALEKIKTFKSYGTRVYFCDLKVHDVSTDEQESFNSLLDEIIGAHPLDTYGSGGSVEDELRSDIKHMEGYIDDYQVVDESFLDEEVDTND